MASLFMVPIAYDGINFWATIISHPDSPSTFEVSFLKESGPSDIPKIILEKTGGKLDLAKNSPAINEGIVKAVVKALENHEHEKSLSA